MPVLYLANPTRQIRQVYYRLDFSVEGVRMDKQPPKNVAIKPGQQIALRFDHSSQVESIVRQISMVGARAAGEKNRLGSATVPIIFSPDKAIPGPLIEEVHNHNRGVHRKRSEEHRKAIAVASSTQVQEAVDNTMAKFQVGGNVEAKLFEAEVEMIDPGQAPLQGKAVAVGLRVQPGEEQAQRQKPGPKPGWKNKQ